MIITNEHEKLCEWVELGINGVYHGYDGQTKAIGRIRNGKLGCAFTFSNFKARHDGTLYDAEIGVYCVDKLCIDRYYLKTVFKYPFAQLGLERVTAVCSVENEGIISQMKRFGFKQEGIHRRGYPTGCDALSFSILRDECIWL